MSGLAHDPHRCNRRTLTRPDGTPIRILAVDDESSLTELLSMAMRYEGWQVSTAASGGQAVKVARETRPDAIVLDMMLPDFRRSEVMRRIRAEDPNVPVIFLTAKDSVEDRIGGLTAGATITSPSRSVSRRSSPGYGRCCAEAARPSPGATRPLVGDLSLDEDSHEVRRGGMEIQLTATEFELLRYLMRNPRRVPARHRSWTGCGITTSAARRTSSSSTSPICVRRSTPTVHR